MTTFNFKETNYKMSLKVGFSSNKEIKPIYNSENFEDLKKQSSFFKKFIYDQTSVSELEEIIKKILNKHQQSLLLANLPPQIDIEFLRVSNLEQFLHALSWNKTKKPYGNSSQPPSYSKKAPIIRISTDFVQNFYNVDFGKLGHEFLDQLRAEFNFNNKDKTKEIITELTFLHEVGHIAFDSKVKHTFLKYSYEIKGISLPTIQRVARLMNEGFADGFCAYLTNLDFPHDDVINKYKQVRLTTKNIFDDSISYYDISNVFNRLSGISKVAFIDDIFEISLQNTLNVVQKKIEQSNIFKEKLEKDLRLLDKHNIFKFDENKSLGQNLESNIRQQLKEPYSPLFVKPQKAHQEVMSETLGQKCINNVNDFLNKFRKNKQKSSKFKT